MEPGNATRRLRRHSIPKATACRASVRKIRLKVICAQAVAVCGAGVDSDLPAADKMRFERQASGEGYMPCVFFK